MEIRRMGAELFRGGGRADRRTDTYNKSTRPF